MHVVLATRNAGKLVELKSLLQGVDVQLTSLADHAAIPEVVEDGHTFAENARKKASEVAQALGIWALADDSGLVVEALGGEPGVHSARYSGGQGDTAGNNAKLLREMAGKTDRRAAFVCTMVLRSPEGREWLVEGRCEGSLLMAPAGTGGFGYDPLFFVSAEGKTMAELPLDRKNAISHRGQAMRQMREVLAALVQELKS